MMSEITAKEEAGASGEARQSELRQRLAEAQRGLEELHADVETLEHELGLKVKEENSLKEACRVGARLIGEAFALEH